jgi:hypothetical protein
VAITSHFLKFQAQAAIKTLISSPTCPLSRFLESLKSDSHANRNKPIKQAVCDRGYVGAKIVLGANIILPKKSPCSYLWVVVLIPAGRTRSLFDKFQTGCAWEVCVAIL